MADQLDLPPGPEGETKEQALERAKKHYEGLIAKTKTREELMGDATDLVVLARKKEDRDATNHKGLLTAEVQIVKGSEATLKPGKVEFWDASVASFGADTINAGVGLHILCPLLLCDPADYYVYNLRVATNAILYGSERKRDAADKFALECLEKLRAIPEPRFWENVHSLIRWIRAVWVPAADNEGGNDQAEQAPQVGKKQTIATVFHRFFHQLWIRSRNGNFAVATEFLYRRWPEIQEAIQKNNSAGFKTALTIDEEAWRSAQTNVRGDHVDWRRAIERPNDFTKWLILASLSSAKDGAENRKAIDAMILKHRAEANGAVLPGCFPLVALNSGVVPSHSPEGMGIVGTLLAAPSDSVLSS